MRPESCYRYVRQPSGLSQQAAPVLLEKPTEDFLSQDPFAGQAARLIAGYNNSKARAAAAMGATEWTEAAEICVLTRIDQLRIIGGLPLHEPPLSPDERHKRLEGLLHLWAEGCLNVVDERLFADILNRHRNSFNRASQES